MRQSQGMKVRRQASCWTADPAYGPHVSAAGCTTGVRWLGALPFHDYHCESALEPVSLSHSHSGKNMLEARFPYSPFPEAVRERRAELV